MKRFFLILMTLILASTSVMAQNKALKKAREKEYKLTMKRYEKEGWKIFGSSRSLQVALLTHYDKLNNLGEEGYEIVGIGSQSASKSLSKDKAENNALISYANKAGSIVKGRIITDAASNGVDISGDFEHFYEAYERCVSREIKNELQESFSVIRETGNRGYEVETYYIVNESAATRARIRAMENALKESEAAQKYAEKVSEFVRKGFEE